MEFQFSAILPHEFKGEAIVFPDSDLYGSSIEYLLILEDENIVCAYEIRYEYHCSPFKQTEIFENTLALGLEDHFYLIDLTRSELLFHTAMSGYFGHIYLDAGFFYIADASDLYCIDAAGGIKWKTSNLGIDGVLIHDFDQDRIHGSGEFDPPGGWLDFVLDKWTGELLSISDFY